MSLYSKLRGTIETLFEIGLAGPNLKSTAGAIEARNAADNAYAIVRGAPPVGPSDLATRQFVETLTARPFVSAQFDGNNALPSNTATARFLIVTTTGANASIGDLLWDDGSSAGTVIKLTAAPRMVCTTQAFSGGTVSLSADTPYIWDADTGAWISVGGSVMSGAIRAIRYALNNSATQDSASQIPANAIARAIVEVTTPYSGGATIAVGRVSDPTLLQATTDNLATVAGTYEVLQWTAWGTAAAVRVTVGGAPAAGAGSLLALYIVPDA